VISKVELVMNKFTLSHLVKYLQVLRYICDAEVREIKFYPLQVTDLHVHSKEGITHNELVKGNIHGKSGST